MTAHESDCEIRDRVLEQHELPQPGDAMKLRDAMCELAGDFACFTMHDALALLAGWRDHPERYLRRLEAKQVMAASRRKQGK